MNTLAEKNLFETVVIDNPQETFEFALGAFLVFSVIYLGNKALNCNKNVSLSFGKLSFSTSNN